MNIIFGDKEYRLKKLECGWELQKWRESEEITRGKFQGQMSKEGWRSMGLYPTTIGSALRLISEDSMTNKVGDVSLRTAMKDVNEYIAGLAVKAEEVGKLINEW